MPDLGLNLVDPDRDPNRSNPAPHYRLYDHPEHGPTTIQVQDFDYAHYDASRFLSYEAFPEKHPAEVALRGYGVMLAQLVLRFRANRLLP